LNDPSYAVIKAAAAALGDTKTPGAYEALAKLLDVSSWRDNIRISGLMGLVALQDKRALDAALRYSDKGNASALKAAAIVLLGRVGQGDPRAYTLIAETATKAAARGDSALTVAAGNALVSIADPRGLPVLEQISEAATISPKTKAQLVEYQQLLRKVVAATGIQGPKQP
jgi:HEAT repeat protein